MAITQRVTARFRSARGRHPRPAGRRPATSGKSDVRNLPVAETRSGLVARARRPPAGEPPTSRASASPRTCAMRALAPRRSSRSTRVTRTCGSTCQPCLVAYPCDAMRAAEDVIAITAKLHLGQPLSGAALLELMTDLVALRATDTFARSPRRIRRYRIQIRPGICWGDAALTPRRRRSEHRRTGPMPPSFLPVPQVAAGSRRVQHFPARVVRGAGLLRPRRGLPC